MEDKKGKNIAVIAYITFVGFIIAFIMNNTTKSSFATFHLRQSFGIVVMFFIASMIKNFNVFGIGIAGTFLVIVSYVFLIFGIISAIQNEKKPFPVIGSYFQEWFTFIK